MQKASHQQQYNPLEEESKSEATNQLKRFECPICFDTAREPVITPCGHLYCWPCIYQWLNQNQDYLQCPVCKNGIETRKLIPLYTREEMEQLQRENQGDLTQADNQSEIQQNVNANQANNNQSLQGLIPPRPRPERQRPVQNMNVLGQFSNLQHRNAFVNIESGIMLAGYGFFPSHFNLIHQVKNNITDVENPSPEIEHQEKFQTIYRIVLIAFVILFFVLVVGERR